MGNPPRISSWRSLLCSFFSSSSFLPILKEYWKKYLALFRPLDLEKKKDTNTAVQFAWNFITKTLYRAVVQNWNFDLSAGQLTGKLITLDFPRCKTNSKLDLRGKRQGFYGKKPNWNALWRNISREITGHTQTRLRSETHWKLLLYLDFRSYFEASSPNCFCSIFSVK